MIPPKGFRNEMYPLTHRVIYAFGLSAVTGTMNSTIATLVRHTNDIIANVPDKVIVNPHNTGYQTDAGPACVKMSIIDKLRLSMTFTATKVAVETDSMFGIKLLWRPIAFSFPEKLDAADDDTTTTVASILNLTKDATFEDIVPLSVNKLPTGGVSEKPHAVSTVNIAEVFGDYNMTTDTAMEDVAHDEDLFQDASMRYTNKGALKACVGRTRHVHLSRSNNVARFFFDKFAPKSIRRIMPYSYFGIQIHVPLISDIEQVYHSAAGTASQPHIGVKMICKYNEWNSAHFQEMSGVAPIPV